MTVRNSFGEAVVSNDDWQVPQAITSAAQARGAQGIAIVGTGLTPSDPREATVALSLPPGAYTAVVSGNGGEQGVALIKVYELDPAGTAAASSHVVNVSTRGRVLGGDNVMIGGFVVRGRMTARNLLVRALEPSLAAAGVSEALADPTLEIRHAAGQPVAFVDDYDQGTTSLATLGALKPNDAREAAVRVSLTPGTYTAVVRGKNGQTGVSRVEAYEVP